MELTGSKIFWLIALGLLVGGIIKLIYRSRGRGVFINLAGGVTGTLISGMIGIKLDVASSLAFGVIGATALLFLLNVFYYDERNEDKPRLIGDFDNS